MFYEYIGASSGVIDLFWVKCKNCLLTYLTSDANKCQVTIGQNEWKYQEKMNSIRPANVQIKSSISVPVQTIPKLCFSKIGIPANSCKLGRCLFLPGSLSSIVSHEGMTFETEFENECVFRKSWENLLVLVSDPFKLHVLPVARVTSWTCCQ